MHELSIAQALVEQVERAAAEQNADRVLRVSVRVGALSGVEEEALQLAFPVACEETILEGAELEIEAVAARVVCKACGKTTQPQFPFFVCEECGAEDVEIVAGRELLLTAVELKAPRDAS